MLTVVLLLISNTFMTFAWYGHLKYRSTPIVIAVLASWFIALGEYCFQVPDPTSFACILAAVVFAFWPSV